MHVAVKNSKRPANTFIRSGERQIWWVVLSVFVTVLGPCAFARADITWFSSSCIERFAQSPLTPRIRMSCKLPVPAPPRSD